MGGARPYEGTVSLRDLAPAAECDMTDDGVVTHSESVEPVVPIAPPVNAESARVENNDTDSDAEHPTPIMGDKGKLWCNVDPKNIMEGRRKR